jgi:hypothetical protein
MGNPFQYQSDLEETYLSDVFATIHRHNVPGMMEVRNEGTVKHIYISGGNVIHAASNERGDRLGAHLYRMGKLSREQLIETMRDASSSDELHGQILIERGLLAPVDLYEAIRAQMEAIVWSVFAWKKGAVSFKIGEPDDDDKRIKIHLPMRQVIVRGIKQVADTKVLVARIGKKTTVFKPTYCTDDLVEIALEKEEYDLLRLVNSERSFFEICNQGPFNLAENARLLYAFRLLGLIEADLSASLTTSGVMIRMGDKAV